MSATVLLFFMKCYDVKQFIEGYFTICHMNEKEYFKKICVEKYFFSYILMKIILLISRNINSKEKVLLAMNQQNNDVKRTLRTFLYYEIFLKHIHMSIKIFLLNVLLLNLS